jgi:hypothetical protein
MIQASEEETRRRIRESKEEIRGEIRLEIRESKKEIRREIRESEESTESSVSARGRLHPGSDYSRPAGAATNR